MLDNSPRHNSHSVSNSDNHNPTIYEKRSGFDGLTHSKCLPETHEHTSRRLDGSGSTAFMPFRSTKHISQPDNYVMATDGPLTASVNADGEDETGSSTKSLDLEHALLESGAQNAVQRASLPALKRANNITTMKKSAHAPDVTTPSPRGPEVACPNQHYDHSHETPPSDATGDKLESGTDRLYGQKRLVVNAPKSWKGRLLGPMEPMELSSVSKKSHNPKLARTSQFYGLPKVYDVPRGVSSLITAPMGPSAPNNEPEHKLPSLTEDSRLARAVANDPVGPRFTATTPDYHYVAVPTHYDNHYNTAPELDNRSSTAPQYPNYAAPNDSYSPSSAYAPPKSGIAGHELNGREYAPSMPMNNYVHSQSYPQIHPTNTTNVADAGQPHRVPQVNGSSHSQMHPHTHTQAHPQTHRSLPNLTTGRSSNSLLNPNGTASGLNLNGTADSNGYSSNNGAPVNYDSQAVKTPTIERGLSGHVLHDITNGGSQGASHFGPNMKQDQQPVVAYPVLFVPESQRHGNTNGLFESSLPDYAAFGSDMRTKDREQPILANAMDLPTLPHPLQALQGYRSSSTAPVLMTSYPGLASTANFAPGITAADDGQLDDGSANPNQRPAGEAKSHHCTYPGCGWSFARSSDYKRHLRSHGKPSLRCPYWQVEPACSKKAGLFYRLDVLKRHLKLVHSIRSTDGTNDGGECRVCSKHFDTTREFIDHCEKCAKEKSETLGYSAGCED